MTLAELDRLREESNAAKDRLRNIREYDSFGREAAYAGYQKAMGRVEVALREWWAQGCKEVAPDANCVTTPDGGCVSTKPCMHWPGVSP